MEKHESIADIQEAYKRRVKLDYPTYQGKGFSYDMSSTEGCLVIPIFYGFEGLYPAYHVNQICWAFHSFLVNSNAVEKNIPMFFYIEKLLWDDAVAQLKAAGIPEERMIQWEAPPRLKKYKGQYFAQKLFTILDPFFDTYGTVAMLEGDTYLATALLDRFDISNLFGKHKDPTNYATGLMKRRGESDEHYLYRKPRITLYYGINDRDEAFALWKSLVKEHLGIETDHIQRTDGGFNAWVPRQLNPTFKSFVKKYAKYFGSEEDLNSLYMQWSGEAFEDVQEMWRLPIKRPGEGIVEVCQKFDYILFHLRMDRIQRDDDIEYFRRVIGQHKELS